MIERERKRERSRERVIRSFFFSIFLSFSFTSLPISHLATPYRNSYTQKPIYTYWHRNRLNISELSRWLCCMYWLMFSCNQVYYCKCALWLLLWVFFSSTFEIHSSGVWLLFGSFIYISPAKKKREQQIQISNTHTVRFLLLFVDSSLCFTRSIILKRFFPRRENSESIANEWVWFCAFILF